MLASNLVQEKIDLRCLLALLLYVILAGRGLQSQALCHGHTGRL